MFRYCLPALLLLTGLAHAADSRVCAPFRDGVVDQALVAEMLEAASDGHLYRIHSTASRAVSRKGVITEFQWANSGVAANWDSSFSRRVI